jgi:outer membrane protein W
MGFEALPFNNPSFINSNDDDGTVKHQKTEFSLGQGFKNDLSFGYLFQDKIGLELKLQYHFGKMLEFNETSVIISVTQKIRKELIGKSINFIPSIVLNHSLNKFFIQSKFGLAVSSINQTMLEETTVDDKTSEKYWQYEKEKCLGMYSNLGFGYKFNENLGIMLSATYFNLNYKPKGMYVEKYKVNGVRVENGLDVNESEVVFVDWSYSPYNQPPQDPDEPSLQVSEIFSYSNYSVNLGIIYSF